MTDGDTLSRTIEATQRSLQERLGEALAPHADPMRAREQYAATDCFLAATSRHLAAVEEALLPAVRRSVPGGAAHVRRYVQVAKRLEQTLAVLKARLYGGAHAVTLSWPALWTRVQAELAEHDRLESAMVEALVEAWAERGDGTRVDELAVDLFRAETRAPTRPHPYLPHTGVLGRVSRRVWGAADRFWDSAEGRVIVEPVRPRPHTHDSLMGQYLVADPRFDASARLRTRGARDTRGRRRSRRAESPR